MVKVEPLSPAEEEYYDILLDGLTEQQMLVLDWLRTPDCKKLSNKKKQQIRAYFNNSPLREDLDNVIEQNTEKGRDNLEIMYKVGLGLGLMSIATYIGEQVTSTTSFSTPDTLPSLTPAQEEGLKILEDYNFELIRNVNEDLASQIREAMTEGISNGEGYMELAQRLINLPFEPNDGNMNLQSRCEMIARTEFSRAINSGTLQAFAQYGVSEVNIITAEDDDVCDECISIAEQNPYTLKEASNLLPLHPNCRCSFEAVPETITNETVTQEPVIDMT